MEPKHKAKLVTELVAAFLTNPMRMADIRNSYDAEAQYKPDYELAVHYANLVVQEIIHVTADPVYFPETVD
jgi:hypothetical protein